MPANVDELVVRVADICTYKWDMIRNRPMAYLVSGFAGGAMVVFGATLALSVSAEVPEKLAPGLANLLMGLVFMFSLVIIMVSGMTLVTADMYIGMIGVFHRHEVGVGRRRAHVGRSRGCRGGGGGACQDRGGGHHGQRQDRRLDEKSVSVASQYSFPQVSIVRI